MSKFFGILDLLFGILFIYSFFNGTTPPPFLLLFIGGIFVVEALKEFLEKPKITPRY